MFSALLQVAIGGALGASARFLLGVSVMRYVGAGGFPVAVLVANVLGSFLMGIFVVIAAHKGLTHLSPLVMTGLLGGFTTFSAFSLEAYTLFERGETGAAALYVTLSVVLSIGGLVLGVFAARGLV